MLSDDLLKKIEFYEQAYFSTDQPVPFKNGLKIYPVYAKDYYTFYSNLPCFTMDKTVKQVRQVDENGVEKIVKVSNPQGISMSYMAYLIDNMENPEYGQIITQQVISMLELVLHIENGWFCPECGETYLRKDLAAKYLEFLGTLPKDMPEDQQRVEQFNFLQEATTCKTCGKPMREIFSIKNTQPIKKLCIYNTELSPRDMDELIAIITHYNILDYEDDKYIDPNLKEDMELKNRLQNKNYSSPSLEKQLVCVSISSPYTIDELKEKVTLRKLALMLKTIDAKNHYYAQIQGAMSRMVTFKEDPKHWIFSENKKDMSKEIMTLNDVQSKFASVT